MWIYASQSSFSEICWDSAHSLLGLVFSDENASLVELQDYIQATAADGYEVVSVQYNTDLAVSEECYRNAKEEELIRDVLGEHDTVVFRFTVDVTNVEFVRKVVQKVKWSYPELGEVIRKVRITKSGIVDRYGGWDVDQYATNEWAIDPENVNPSEYNIVDCNGFYMSEISEGNACWKNSLGFNASRQYYN